MIVDLFLLAVALLSFFLTLPHLISCFQAAAAAAAEEMSSQETKTKAESFDSKAGEREICSGKRDDERWREDVDERNGGKGRVPVLSRRAAEHRSQVLGLSGSGASDQDAVGDRRRGSEGIGTPDSAVIQSQAHVLREGERESVAEAHACPSLPGSP